jgi:hypothetical protein
MAAQPWKRARRRMVGRVAEGIDDAGPDKRTEEQQQVDLMAAHTPPR